MTLLQPGEAVVVFDDDTAVSIPEGIMEVMASVVEMQNSVIHDLEMRVGALESDLANQKKFAMEVKTRTLRFARL